MTMHKTQLNKNSPAFSRIVTGVWKWGNWGAKLSIDEIGNLISCSLDQGISSFDHADIYGDYLEEERFGQALSQSSIPRDQIEIISKCGIKLPTENRPSHSLHHYDTSKEHILLSVENSLRALRTDYLDLLLIHRPSPLMSLETIAGAFEKLKQEGKVRSFGVSNFTSAQFDALQEFTELSTNQIEASLVRLDPFLDGTILQGQKNKFHPMAWSPLGSGRLMKKPETEQEIRIYSEAEKLSDKYSCDLAQLYLAFLLKHPAGILPILGTSKQERIITASKAIEIKLTQEDWFRLWIASTGEAVP